MYLNAHTHAIETAGLLNFKSTPLEDYVIKVFDVQGKHVITLKSPSLDFGSINIEVAAGTYVLNAFKKGEFIKSFRLVKE